MLRSRTGFWSVWQSEVISNQQPSQFLIMTNSIVRFLNIFMAALVAGAIFGIWIGYNPASLSATAYLEQQQNAIRSLNVLMPILGAITILLTLLSAYLQRKSRTVFISLLVAAAFFIISGLVTRLGNQPINAIVIKWQADSIPAEWTELRDQWWQFHILRTLSSLVGLALVIWTSIRKD